MEEIKDLERIKTFVDTLQNYRVESTGAAVVTVNANLYNVDGSTYDPKKFQVMKEIAGKNYLLIMALIIIAM